MRKDSPEFLRLLARVPTHRHLIPEKDVWQKEDEYRVVKRDFVWSKVEYTGMEGSKILPLYEARRPIPEFIRRHWAWWGLYNRIATVQPGQWGVVPQIVNGRVSMSGITQVNYGIRKFETDEKAFFAVTALGGDNEFIANFEVGPGLFESWSLT